MMGVNIFSRNIDISEPTQVQDFTVFSFTRTKSNSSRNILFSNAPIIHLLLVCYFDICKTYIHILCMIGNHPTILGLKYYIGKSLITIST